MKNRPADLLMLEHLLELFGPFSTAPEHRFNPDRKWRLDFAVLGLKLGIEIEGGIWTNGRHSRGKGYQSDLHKYATATAMGWTVFRFSVEDVLTGKDLEYLRQWLANRQEAA